MAYNMQYRYVSNSRISSRGRQMIALIGAIIVGMIISAAVNALPSSKSAKVATKLETTVLK